jgi:hypothetical protein
MELENATPMSQPPSERREGAGVHMLAAEWARRAFRSSILDLKPLSPRAVSAYKNNISDFEGLTTALAT